MIADPVSDEPPVLAQVGAALQASDIPRATTLARDALAAGIEHPVLLNLRAFWFEGQGRDAEAFADLERARVLAPGNPAINNALGLAYARSQRHREAIECFDAVIAAAPDFGPAHFNKAWASEALGDVTVARDCYLQANQLMPANPDPLAGLAAIAGRRGDWPQVKSFADRALAIDPAHPLANTVLAAAEAATGAEADAESRLRALLSRADLLPVHRASAEGQLGDLLDAQGRVGEAFAAYEAGNRMLRHVYAPRYEGPGIETTPMSLRWLTEVFESADPADWAAGSSDADFEAAGPAVHVFMVGFPRSGTTLLEQVLGSHPAVVTSGERDTLNECTRELMGTPGDVRRLAGLHGTALAGHRRTYWRRVREHGIDVAGRVFIDKQPYYTLKLPLIARLFPAAKIVFSLRDPRDVVLSCFRRRFLMSAPNFEFLTLEGTARLYDATMRLAELYRAKLPLDLLQLRHEDLVSDFEPRVRDTCDFIGLTWQDSMRDFAARARTQAIVTPSSVQVTKGINREGIGHWRRYAPQLAPVLPILQPWVERFGYPAD
ncbi:MAG TPA: sulfotransferase [Casimicrobiaceae bacterium]|nr:sulfotransferase [Casimicrobiaceae bacterium]